jgi:hypothetical protein
MNNTENSRNKRRDAKHRQRYKPVRLGLPQGLTKAQWIQKKLQEQQDKKKDGGSDDSTVLCIAAYMLNCLCNVKR